MTPSALTSLQAAFERLAPRERSLLTAASCLLVMALVWWIALAPALQTWRDSASSHAKLDAQLAQMQRLAQEATRLKAAPVISPKEAESWLVQSVKKLGKSTVSLPAGGLSSGLVQVTLIGADAAALAVWLTDARTAAGLIPVEAHWRRNLQNADKPSTSSQSAQPSNSALWDGSLTLKLASAPPQ
jgi:general secretion pathway protein M